MSRIWVRAMNMHPYRQLTVWVPLSVWLLASPAGNAPTPTAEPSNRVTAIDILIEPDATMATRAAAANARLRETFPQGFTFDETRQPWITCLQRRVRTADLDEMYGAIGRAVVMERPGAWKLKAYAYDYVPWEDLALGIVFEQTDGFIRFQRKLADAVAPFAERAAADETAGSGTESNPLVAVGVAAKDDLKKMIDEKFEPFIFSPAAVSIYQLSEAGNARKKIKSWELTP
jgi:hypothetical protein